MHTLSRLEIHVEEWDVAAPASPRLVRFRLADALQHGRLEFWRQKIPLALDVVRVPSVNVVVPHPPPHTTGRTIQCSADNSYC